MTGPVSPLSDGSLPSLLHETAVPEAVRRVDQPPYRVLRTRAGDTLTVHSPRCMPTSVHVWAAPGRPEETYASTRAPALEGCIYSMVSVNARDASVRLRQASSRDKTSTMS